MSIDCITVAVIVPCRNEVNFVENFLQSVLKQNLKGIELEIIIADGMSSDGTRRILQDYDNPRVTMIDNPELIVPTGLNRAIAVARSEIIVRMDVHSEYDTDYVRTCAHKLIDTEAQCVGGPWVAKGQNIRQNAIADAFQSRLASGGAPSRNIGFSGYVDTVYLGSWRKDFLKDIGGFDEALVRNQDDELCLRIKKTGGKIWQDKDIKSVYYPRDAISKVVRQFFQYGYWKIAVIKKHKMPASWRHLAPFLFYITLAVLLIATLFSAAAGIGFLVLFTSYMSAIVIAGLHYRSIKPNVSAYQVLYFGLTILCMHAGYALGFGFGVISNVLGLGSKQKFVRGITR